MRWMTRSIEEKNNVFEEVDRTGHPYRQVTKNNSCKSSFGDKQTKGREEKEGKGVE